jgi:hypothetical protein
MRGRGGGGSFWGVGVGQALCAGVTRQAVGALHPMQCNDEPCPPPFPLPTGAAACTSPCLWRAPTSAWATCTSARGECVGAGARPPPPGLASPHTLNRGGRVRRRPALLPLLLAPPAGAPPARGACTKGELSFSAGVAGPGTGGNQGADPHLRLAPPIPPPACSDGEVSFCGAIEMSGALELK